MSGRENLGPAWKPGQSGNPGGKTKEQRRRELRNAEMATMLRERMLEAELAKVEADPSHVPDLSSDMLKLIKDSEDRGLGAPKQTVEAEVGMIDRTIRLVDE